jgi:hypothetical protein
VLPPLDVVGAVLPGCTVVVPGTATQEVAGAGSATPAVAVGPLAVLTLVAVVARAPIAAPIPKKARALTAAATARDRVLATFLRFRGRGVESGVIADLLLDPRAAGLATTGAVNDLGLGGPCGAAVDQL